MNITLAYIRNGEIRTRQYIDADSLAFQHYTQISENKSVVSVVAINPDGFLMTSHCNKTAVWQIVPCNLWPQLILDSVKAEMKDRSFLGTKLFGWKEGEVYMVEYTWIDRETGLKTIQRSMWGKNGGAVRWFEYD